MLTALESDGNASPFSRSIINLQIQRPTEMGPSRDQLIYDAVRLVINAGPVNCVRSRRLKYNRPTLYPVRGLRSCPRELELRKDEAVGLLENPVHRLAAASFYLLIDFLG